MSLLYNNDFIFKFIDIYKYIHISLSSICQSGYKLLVLSLLLCGCQRLLLPALTYQSFHLHAHTRPQPSSRDSLYSVSGLCFSIFMSSRPSYRRQTWLCEPYNSTKTYLSRNECVAGSFQGLYLPLCSQLLYIRGN